MFYVEDGLRQSISSGAFLTVFFLAAGISVPFWAKLSTKIGVRDALTIAMAAAALGLFGAAFLTPETSNWFWIVCIVTGGAIGADLVLLPILFTTALDQDHQPAGQGFGLWFFVSKLSLAAAAIITLPILESVGFRAGEVNSASAITTLFLLYAVLPCILKSMAILLLRRIPKEVFAI